MKKFYLLLGLMFVSLALFAGTITITAPNGGEVWPGCTQKIITWNASGVSNNYSIDYSVNNGSSWISVTSGLYITNYQYTWTVPNVSSTSCLVRVTDSNTPATFDVSDATFSITAPLLLITPNGGETWQGGSTQAVTFVASGTTNYYDIKYSLNGGASYTDIVNNQNITNGTYSWSVPNNPSTSCLIKIQDHTNTSCMYDISDNLFTITPATPVITVTSPNTNVTWYVGKTYNITWTSQWVTSNAIKIDYSTNNGTSWVPVVTNTTNSGSYSWLIPNTPSTQCLVKVTDLGNPATYDISNVNFIIAPPFVTVTAPNGSETLTGCYSQTITWNSGGTGTSFTIKYSVNNGSTWTTITSSASGSSYNWNPVPNVSSTQALIKVYDTGNSATVDSSNAVFTISPNTDVIVTVPNGGESWQVGTSQIVTWVSAPTSTYFNVYYSTNNGTGWTSLTSYTSNYTYSWTIPNYPGTQNLVKVEDYNNTCKYDISDAVFTISPPTPVITVTSPNTAVTWYVGNSYNITWTTQYVTSSYVKIEYSTNNGSTWTDVAAVTENDGTYAWTVPNTLSTQCLVKVSDYYTPSTYDVSNTAFTIAAPYITVTAPNGTESWNGCSTQSITWNYAGVTNSFTVKYSTNNGAAWTTLSASATSGSYSWNPVPSISSATALVKVISNGTPAVLDSSNAVFTITPNTDVIVTIPNGGENWQVGTSQTVTWVSAPTSTYFNVYYSTNNGTGWTSLISYTSNHTYSWSIPNYPGTQNLVKVEDYNNTCKFDVSNAVFTITPPTPVITVTSPNTAVTWYVGNSYNITWSTQYVTATYVKIEYSTNNGSTWTDVAAVTENDGAYSWNVPNTPSANCLVKVSDYTNPTTYDVSNVNFTIAVPYITVTSPNGGENWKGCSSKSITWSYAGTSNSFNVKLSSNNGSSWTTLTSSASSGSYTWNPVLSINSANCLVKVTDNGNAAYKDSSNAVFTLVKNTDIIVTAPNGGENWQVATSQNITWVTEPTSTYYNVYYSTNNGTGWTSLYSYTSSHTYAWTIPNYPGTQNLVKVEDYYNSCIYDLSDANFTIAPPMPYITVNSPNTAVTWYVGNAYNITWSSGYLTSSFVAIDYSTNNGTSWTQVINVTENDGAYSWTVPNAPSATCLVRVSEYNNPATFDVSNVNFTIAVPYITVTSPNGGESWKGCSSKSITWNYAGTSNSFNLKLSTNNGSSWSTITSSASSGSYTWNPVPSINSANCLVKVTDNGNAAYKDSSNAVFTLVKNTDIIVTAPNGGENWQVATSQNITWVTEPTSTYYNVYYSTNNGTGWTSLYSYTSSHTYAWTIPNYPGTQNLVKVEDYYNSCIYDISDANFTIAPPTPYITVNSPNTAVTWYVGTAYNITWSSGYLTSSFVAIDYSTNNGTSWTQIINVTENDGTYSWTVPNAPSVNCLVRVSEYNNPTTYDVSNANFTIAIPSLVVTAPNGGENLEACNTQSVTWNSWGLSGSYKIYYSTNNGAAWNLITSSASGSSYNWTIPTVSPLSGNCRIKVQNVNYPSAFDSSDATFTMKPNDDVIVTSPNGGESWQVATSQTISWVSDPGSTYFAVYYSSNNGSTWTSINSYTSAHSVSWTIPNSPGSNYLIKVEDYNNTCKYDVSNASFTVTPAQPQLLTPNGGNTLYYASSYSITWTNQYFNGTYVSLYLSADSGLTWSPIASVTENDGTYSWTIPAIYSNKCLVKVTEYNNPSVYDVSNAVFSINPALVISSPNGDNGSEEWRVCTQTSIHWTAGGCSGTYKIEYSTNNGSTWSTITSSYSAGGTGSITYDWAMPNTPSTLCLVRVTDAGNSAKTDVSDATFTLKPAITVATPNGGESLTVGGSYSITWTSLGASNSYNIDYSTNNGSAWTNIVFNQTITNNTYSWTVPSASSSNCLIKITDNLNTCKTDQSNATFAIGLPAATITVTAPNGGETLTGCNTMNITWNSVSTSNNYTIDYTKDNGATWTTIVSNYNTLSGTYAWTVPNVSSTQCKVKIKDFSSPTVMDESNTNFTISQSVAATVTPGGPTTFCAGNSVILTSSSSTGNVWSPGGQTTQAITVSSTGSYYVVVTSGSCSATSNTVNVTVNPLPGAPVASSNSPVMLNGTIQLNASTVAGASYSWTGPNSFTSALQNPSIPNAQQTMSGTYSVVASVNGCNSTAGTVSVTVSSTPAVVNVSGIVRTETGVAVPGVTLTCAGGTTQTYSTTTNGQYLFSVNDGQSYTITPDKNNDVNTSNGITTLDIILTQRHILGTQALNSAYKIIAADVNASSSVSSLDLVLMRSVVLQTSTTFPNGALWKFVNSDFSFTDVMNPFPFENSRSYSDISVLTDQNFVAAKLGDVNNSWNASISKSGETGSVTFTMESVTAPEGNLITVPVKVENFNAVSGYQFTITWDPSLLSYVGTNNSALTNFFGTNRTGEGILTALWSTENLNGVTLPDGSVAFELLFNVMGNAGTQAQISINSSSTLAEAYDNNLNTLDIISGNSSITIENATALLQHENCGYALLQNYPNPFSDYTNISFVLPKDEKVTITILNYLGETVKQFTDNYAKGMNQVTWDCNTGSGSYIVKMQADKFTGMKKMVVIR
ncbi:MAG: T9SS type A sorting domain-containing protein [Bacteroidia bacterium]|nr:T9SS type A sorting domain-containing protein [Bacteroidia bacterium]